MTSPRTLPARTLHLALASLASLASILGCTSAAAPTPSAASAAQVASVASVASPSATPAAPSTCPAPKPSKDACAAVMTYVKLGGVCCAYPDPCSAPDGPAFDDPACRNPHAKH